MRNVCCYAGSPRGVTVDVGHIWAVSGRGLKGHHDVAAKTLASDTKGSCIEERCNRMGSAIGGVRVGSFSLLNTCILRRCQVLEVIMLHA